MRMTMLLFAPAITLGACGITTASFDGQLWARGAEANTSSDCAAKTCFGF